MRSIMLRVANCQNTRAHLKSSNPLVWLTPIYDCTAPVRCEEGAEGSGPASCSKIYARHQQMKVDSLQVYMSLMCTVYLLRRWDDRPA